jgi:hypothetical protein
MLVGAVTGDAIGTRRSIALEVQPRVNRTKEGVTQTAAVDQVGAGLLMVRGINNGLRSTGAWSRAHESDESCSGCRDTQPKGASLPPPNQPHLRDDNHMADDASQRWDLNDDERLTYFNSTYPQTRS